MRCPRTGDLHGERGQHGAGIAWCARSRDIPFTAIVPEHAPAAKLSKLEELGARLVRVPFDRWWQVLREHRFEDVAGRFIHPVADAAVMAGNGTIGLEILEELPQVETVLVPFGGGGLSCGIERAGGNGLEPGSSAARSRRPRRSERRWKPGLRGWSRARQASWTGSAARGILPEMWPLIQRLLDSDAVVSLAEAAAAIRLLVGGARGGGGRRSGALAAALGTGDGRRGLLRDLRRNIDTQVLAEILAGA
jgi:threonine dehydratase